MYIHLVHDGMRYDILHRPVRTSTLADQYDHGNTNEICCSPANPHVQYTIYMAVTLQNDWERVKMGSKGWINSGAADMVLEIEGKLLTLEK